MSGESEKVAELLRSARAPHWFGLVGFGMVVFAFLVSVVNALLPEPNAFVLKVLMPFIFVGVASLRYHKGQHVHAMHQNALRMILMESEATGEKSEHAIDKGKDNGQ